MDKDSLGTRMKDNYEKAFSYRLPSRMPIILRLDGKSFHSFTKGMDKPFDENLVDLMSELAWYMCTNTHTAQLAYVQSDEISILLHNYKKLDTCPYFSNEVQKICSVSAGMASSYLSLKYGREAIFDARVFVLPESEVVNYFVWRQLDATRNSISMVAQSKFTQKELNGKSSKEMQEMMFQKDGTNWDKLPTRYKRGVAVKKYTGVWTIDNSIPKFTEDRDYITRLLNTEELCE